MEIKEMIDQKKEGFRKQIREMSIKDKIHRFRNELLFGDMDLGPENHTNFTPNQIMNLESTQTEEVSEIKQLDKFLSDFLRQTSEYQTKKHSEQFRQAYKSLITEHMDKLLRLQSIMISDEFRNFPIRFSIIKVFSIVYCFFQLSEIYPLIENQNLFNLKVIEVIYDDQYIQNTQLLRNCIYILGNYLELNFSDELVRHLYTERKFIKRVLEIWANTNEHFKQGLLWLLCHFFKSQVVAEYPDQIRYVVPVVIETIIQLKVNDQSILIETCWNFMKYYIQIDGEYFQDNLNDIAGNKQFFRQKLAKGLKNPSIDAKYNCLCVINDLIYLDDNYCKELIIQDITYDIIECLDFNDRRVRYNSLLIMSNLALVKDSELIDKLICHEFLIKTKKVLTNQDLYNHDNALYFLANLITNCGEQKLYDLVENFEVLPLIGSYMNNLNDFLIVSSLYEAFQKIIIQYIHNSKAEQIISLFNNSGIIEQIRQYEHHSNQEIYNSSFEFIDYYQNLIDEFSY